jgi:hypothetical protein
MNKRGLSLLWMVTCVLCICATNVLAAAGSNIVYFETAMGGGQWQYDYSFCNTSTTESLFSVYFYFAQETSFTGVSLPAGWEGIVWDGTTWTTGFADTFSTGSSFDISPGRSLSGFSFMVDHRVGNISYDAFFSGDNVVSGTTIAVVPEPASPLFFVTGGIFLAGRVYLGRRTSDQ